MCSVVTRVSRRSRARWDITLILETSKKRRRIIRTSPSFVTTPRSWWKKDGWAAYTCAPLASGVDPWTRFPRRCYQTLAQAFWHGQHSRGVGVAVNYVSPDSRLTLILRPPPLQIRGFVVKLLNDPRVRAVRTRLDPGVVAIYVHIDDFKFLAATVSLAQAARLLVRDRLHAVGFRTTTR